MKKHNVPMYNVWKLKYKSIPENSSDSIYYVYSYVGIVGGDKVCGEENGTPYRKE